MTDHLVDPLTLEEVPPLPRHTFRRERLLPALAPESVAIDDRQADDLLRLMADFAHRLVPLPLDRGDASAADEMWIRLVEGDVSFLLAEMASVDAVQEFFDYTRAPAELQRATAHTRDRLLRWRARARALDAAVRVTPAIAQRPADDATATSVEGDLLHSIETVLSRELPQLSVPHELTVIRDASSAAETSGAQRTFFDLNRVTRLLSDLARTYFTRSLTEKSNHAPHVGLLLAFVQLLVVAKGHLNQLSERHLDFFYRRVLRLTPRPADPDRGWVVLRLAPTIANYLLPAGTPLLADGGDSAGPRRYVTDEALAVTRASVDAIRAMYVRRTTYDHSSATAVRHVVALPVANSADGRGLPLDDPGEGWPIFGVDETRDLDRAELLIDAGLVIASPALLLREGVRRVRLTFTMDDGDRDRLSTVIREYRAFAESQLDVPMSSAVFASILADVLLVAVSGPNGYVDVKDYALTADDATPDELRLEFTRGVTDPPMCAPIDATQSMLPPGSAPSVRIRLNPDARVYAFSWFARLVITRLRIDASVRGLRSLSLVGPQGPVATDAPFPVFGVIPERGSFLIFGNDELWNKPLSRMRLHIEWANLPQAPETIATHYAAYRLGTTSDVFRLRCSVLEGYRWRLLGTRPDLPLEESATVPCFPRDANANGGPTSHATWEWPLLGLELRGQGAGVAPLLYTSSTADGVFRLELTEPSYGFAHQQYPRLVIDSASRMWPSARRRMRDLTQHPPWTPLASRITLDYDASVEFDVQDAEGHRRDDDAPASHRVWQIGPFGRIRPLRPGDALVLTLTRQGYLFLGLTGVRAPESLSLYLHLREDVGDGWRDPARSDSSGGRTPPVGREASEVRWRYLAPDGWRDLPRDAVIADGTLGLLRSGIIRLDLPPDAIPSPWSDETPRVWLELSVADDPSRYGRVLGIYTQSVSVTRVISDATTRESRQLPPMSIARLAAPLPQIASVTQPAPTVSGRVAEDVATYRARVSERIRHGNRAILPRDYESLVLDRFPSIGEVRCVTMTGGRLVIVVVPQRLKGVCDLRPSVARPLCRDIALYLRSRCSGFVRAIYVRSPWYETVRVSAWLRFQPGRRADGIRAVTTAIESFLAPWRSDETLRLGIGTGAFELSELRATLDARREQLGLRRVVGMSAVHHYRQFTEDLDRGAYCLRDSVRDMVRSPAKHGLQEGAVDRPTHAHPSTHPRLFQVHTPWSVFVPADVHLLRDEPDPSGLGGVGIGESLTIVPGREGGASRGAREVLWPPVLAGVGNLQVGQGFVVPLHEVPREHGADITTEDRDPVGPPSTSPDP